MMPVDSLFSAFSFLPKRPPPLLLSPKHVIILDPFLSSLSLYIYWLMFYQLAFEFYDIKRLSISAAFQITYSNNV